MAVLGTARHWMAGKVAHGGKDGQNFLGMVAHIVRLLPHFHEQVHHIRLYGAEPRMRGVELIPEDEAQGGTEHGTLL